MIPIFWYGGIYCISNIKFVEYSSNKSKVLSDVVVISMRLIIPHMILLVK